MPSFDPDPSLFTQFLVNHQFWEYCEKYFFFEKHLFRKLPVPFNTRHLRIKNECLPDYKQNFSAFPISYQYFELGI